MGTLRGRGRLLIGLGAALVAVGGVSAGAVALRHGTAQQPVSTVVTPAAGPTRPATADFPAWTPAPVPTATPTPVAAATPVPTPRPTAKPTPRPTATPSLPHCDLNNFINTTTATRRSDGTVLIDMHIHEEWQRQVACMVPHGCRLGYTVYNRMGGPVVATDEPVRCTTWARYTGDFDISAVWSTCHGTGDYQINTESADFTGMAYYTASGTEPASCPPQQ